MTCEIKLGEISSDFGLGDSEPLAHGAVGISLSGGVEIRDGESSM